MSVVPVIETVEALNDACLRLAQGTGPIAVDAERASGFRYSQRAYLIQLHREGTGTLLVDPIPFPNLTPLAQVIQNEEWVFHAASQDLSCLREIGLDPKRIFDTELAARLLGFPRVALGTVVSELLNVNLAKEHSASDWSTRPLPESWLNYAALDVKYLLPLRRALIKLLAENTKTAIAYAEFYATLKRAPKPSRTEPWRRLSGVQSLRNPRNLAIARELWLARDHLAQSRDIAPGRLVPDASLVAVAKINPDSKKVLSELNQFIGRTSRSDIDIWWAAIETGRTTKNLPASREPSDGPPIPRTWPNRHPEASIRLKFARDAVATIADELVLPSENLLAPDTLRRLSWRPPPEINIETINAYLTEHDVRQWQRNYVSVAIVEAFQLAANTDPEIYFAEQATAAEAAEVAAKTVATKTTK